MELGAPATTPDGSVALGSSSQPLGPES
uniref:Uncharacterized protein n=1 Tax=Arundo donax TaxID=35708 RepID=A0A0A9BK95_ARUDO